MPTGFAIQRVNLSVSYYVNHTRCICFIIRESRSAAYSRPIWNKLVLESQAIADADNRKSVTQSSQTAHLPNVIICRLTVTCFAVCKADSLHMSSSFVRNCRTRTGRQNVSSCPGVTVDPESISFTRNRNALEFSPMNLKFLTYYLKTSSSLEK